MQNLLKDLEKLQFTETYIVDTADCRTLKAQKHINRLICFSNETAFTFLFLFITESFQILMFFVFEYPSHNRLQIFCVSKVEKSESKSAIFSKSGKATLLVKWIRIWVQKWVQK